MKVPRINAHRGQSSTHPENTVPALLEAVRLGADGAEFDVHPTQDGSIVLMHDRSPLRTTNSCSVMPGKVGLPVQRFTLAEIAALDAGSWKHSDFAGTPVPTVRDVMKALRGVHLRLSVELKECAVDPGLFVRRTLDELGGREDVTLMSFDRAVCRAALPLHPSVGLVTARRPTADDLATFDEFHVDARQIDRRLVEAVHASGSTLTAWTVDDPADHQRLADLGVDAVTTNDVTIARTVSV